MIIDKWCMMHEMRDIANECIKTHKGGETYFTELDSMIKQNENLMINYINYIIKKEKINDVIISGEIGEVYKNLWINNKIPFNIKLHLLPGGLRNNVEIKNTENSNKSIYNKELIFIDDSFYSGKTLNKVDGYVTKNRGLIKTAYVFYDGSLEKHDHVKSLYRYYDYH